MRFMMMIKGNCEYEAGKPPNPALMAGMGKLTEEMMKAGVLLASEGLQPSCKGIRISFANGKRTITDGPFAEAKEVVGGFALIKAESREHALQLANRCVDVHANAGVDVEMEIRPLFEPQDFAPR